MNRSPVSHERLLRPVLLVAAGLGTALGQAPWGLWPLALAGLTVVALDVARAPAPAGGFRRAWIAGAAGFALAMVWIVEPFLVEPERHAWMAPIALPLMAGGMALFWGAAGAFAVWAARGTAARLAVFALAMLGAEALRGHLLTGFPWAMLGHVWIDTPLAQLAALGGALGLSALSLGLAAALAGAWLALGRGRAGRAAGIGAAALAVAGGGWLWGATRLSEPEPPARDFRVRLVQPNAPQALKWHPAHAQEFFWRHLELSAAPARDGRPPDLVVWSETAVPFFLHNPGDGLWLAAEAAGGAQLALGIQRREITRDGARRYFNSLVVLDPEARPVAIYDKHHLVPFGEYVPLLGRFAGRPGFAWASGFAAQALIGYSPGPGPALIDFGAAGGRALPLICYEAIFPRNLALAERPDWLLQITNDAWFGARIGPFQHLAQARLRAIEQGLPLIRAANTGVSAVIDARGQVVAALGMDRMGALDADLPGARAAPPYARRGDLWWHLGLAAGLGGIALAALRRKRLTA